MLQNYLEKICLEFAIAKPKLNEQKEYLFHFGKEAIAMRDLHPGLAMRTNICELPKQRLEELFLYLSRANLLGQGTGSTRIGIDKEENFLTLSLGLPYELDYQRFKETIEDFVNYVIYWRDEVTKFEIEKSAY